jgi:hypothetical protein
MKEKKRRKNLSDAIKKKSLRAFVLRVKKMRLTFISKDGRWNSMELANFK